MPLEIKTPTFNQSPSTKCWRLVYKADTKKITLLSELEGITRTMDPLFCSLTKDECDAEIARLGLVK